MASTTRFPESFNPWQDKDYRRKILFIGGIPLDCTWTELFEVISKQGKVTWMRIERDQNTGTVKGYAFAIMDSDDDRDRMLRTKNYKMRGGSMTIGITLWKDPKEYLDDKAKVLKRKVFIKRLTANATDEDLHEYFRQFGQIEKAEVRRNHTDNTSRRIAYVTFVREEDASRCLNTKMHMLNGREIVCKKCKDIAETKKDNSNCNDTFDSSKYHSYTVSNESSWIKAQDYSCISAHIRNNRVDSSSFFVEEDTANRSHEGSGRGNVSWFLNTSLSRGPANISMPSPVLNAPHWSQGITPICEKEETPLWDMNPAELFANSLLMYPKAASEYLEDLHEPIYRTREVVVGFYTFPGRE